MYRGNTIEDLPIEIFDTLSSFVSTIDLHNTNRTMKEKQTMRSLANSIKYKSLYYPLVDNPTVLSALFLARIRDNFFSDLQPFLSSRPKATLMILKYMIMAKTSEDEIYKILKIRCIKEYISHAWFDIMRVSKRSFFKGFLSSKIFDKIERLSQNSFNYCKDDNRNNETVFFINFSGKFQMDIDAEKRHMRKIRRISRHEEINPNNIILDYNIDVRKIFIKAIAGETVYARLNSSCLRRNDIEIIDIINTNLHRISFFLADILKKYNEFFVENCSILKGKVYDYQIFHCAFVSSDLVFESFYTNYPRLMMESIVSFGEGSSSDTHEYMQQRSSRNCIEFISLSDSFKLFGPDVLKTRILKYINRQYTREMILTCIKNITFQLNSIEVSTIEVLFDIYIEENRTRTRYTNKDIVDAILLLQTKGLFEQSYKERHVGVQYDNTYAVSELILKCDNYMLL